MTTLPAGATKLYPWEDRDGEPVRPFRGTAGAVIKTITGTVETYVDGLQSLRDVVRTVILDDVELTADQARRLAAGLVAAADEAEGA